MTGIITAGALLLILAIIGLVRMTRRLSATRNQLHEFLHEDQERADRRRRVFDVLHEVGDAIVEGQPDPTIHRLIAEGAAKVVESDGSILYLLEEKSQTLVPRYCTKDCPPLINLPERIIDQTKTNPNTLSSFLRLHSIPYNDGIIGEVFCSQEEQNISDLRKHPLFKSGANPFQNHVAALIAPLRHGSKKLGILATASNSGKEFSQHELEMFVSLAIQCGFALGNAQAYHEVNAKRSLDAELRNASEIQKILLPERAPQMSGFEIAGKNIPARHVSGDYYDFFSINESHTGVAIADVCGKGIPASLLTAMCRSVLRSHARDNNDPVKVMSQVNRNLFPDIREDMFITVSYLVIAKDGSKIQLARAGHTNPLVWRKATQTIEEIKAPGLAVGVDKGDVFERITKAVDVFMEPGDVMLLYTDGIDEATDHKGLLFGVDRIKTALALSAINGAEAVIEAITQAVQNFMEGDPQSDDITLVAILRK